MAAPAPVTEAVTDRPAPVVAPPGAVAAHRRARWPWVVGAATLVLVVAVLALRLFVLEPFTVPSDSMLPTLQPGDHIVVNRLALDFRSIHRGDVVVFRAPSGIDSPYPYLVKRVIGLPGDVISEDGQGNVAIDGQDISEPYLFPGSETTGLPFGPADGIRVPPGEYFVMGDNREHSEDSRGFGPIPRSSIVGVVVARIWPPSRWGGV